MEDVVCGSAAGAAGKIIEYPFDTAKVRLQTQDHAKPLYKGPLDCIRKTIRNEGFLGLYRGLGLPMVGAAAENATLFLSFGIFKSLVAPLRLNETPEALVCGALGGLSAAVVLTPIELIKCQVQLEGQMGSRRRSTLQMVKSTIKADGLKGLWRGHTGTSLREAGGSASWFGSYRFVMERFQTYYPSQNKDNPPIWQAMIAGACAGVAYNLSLFPADTVKSRMQTESMLGRSHQSFVATFVYLLKNGGVPALYRGCGITCARAAPSSAIIFLTYEKLKVLWGKYL